MPHNPHRQDVFRFGVFELDPRAGELRKSGVRLRLQEQPLQVLLMLLERPGDVVTREELQQRLWPDGTFVDFDKGVNTAVQKVRDALGDSPDTPRFVETVPRRGYRFIYPVEQRIRPGLLRRAARGGSTPRDTVSPAPAKRLVWLLAGAAVTVAVLILVAARVSNQTDVERQGPARATRLTNLPGRELSPSFNPAGDMIAFLWDGGAGRNLDLYIKSVGPGEPIRLTDTPEMEVSPDWSPDGQWIAFGRVLPRGMIGIYIMPASGGVERKLAERPSGPPLIIRYVSWTHDNDWIVVPDGRTRPIGLYALNVNTLEEKRLTSPPDGSIGDPWADFSADGRAVAFTRSYDFGVIQPHVLELSESMEPVGEPRPVTPGPISVRGVVWGKGEGELVYFSKRSGYAPVSLVTTPAEGSAQPRWIYDVGHFYHTAPLWIETTAAGDRLATVVPDVESSIRRVRLSPAGEEAQAPAVLIDSSGLNLNPDYSPDGERVAFASSRATGRLEIWICRADGTLCSQRTNYNGFSHSPRWSPDGKSISFTSRTDDGNGDIFIMDPEAGEPRLIAHPADEHYANWSRDGEWLYFGSNRSGDWETWKMPAAGGEPLRVTNNGGTLAKESPDGKTVFFVKGGDIATTPVWKLSDSSEGESVVIDSIVGHHFVPTEDGIYFVPTPPPGSGFTLRFMSFADGEARKIADIEHPLHSTLELSPDGRYLIFSQYDDIEADIVMLEDF